MKKLSLFVSAFALCASSSFAAINCGTLPTCDSLGYKDKKAECPSSRFLACPFDTNTGKCIHDAQIGQIRLWAGLTVPDGWLLCDGQDYAKTDYKLLYDAIGETFGKTNSGFKVPDLRGRVPVGVNPDLSTFTKYSMGATGGEEKHTLTISEIPSHSHSYSAPLTAGDHPGGNGGYKRPNGAESGTTGSKGNGLSHENRMPYIAIQYIIFSGVYKDLTK